jgi:hypothetical protein
VRFISLKNNKTKKDQLQCITLSSSSENSKFFESLGFRLYKQKEKPIALWLWRRDPLSNSLAMSENLISSASDVYQIKGVNVKGAIGEGKFGEVFLGEWEGTLVALKRLREGESTEFYREIAIVL